MNELGNTPADKNYKPSGISKAEERALEAYPVTMVRRRYDGIVSSDDPYDSNLHDRYCFQRGYEQAEKDLALTWLDVQLLDHFVLELVREEKEGKDWGDGKGFYTEVLTRFKQFKEENK